MSQHDKGKPWDNPEERAQERRIVAYGWALVVISAMFLVWFCHSGYGQAPAGTEKDYGGNPITDAYRSAAGAVSGINAQNASYRAGYAAGLTAGMQWNPTASQPGNPQYDAESLGGRDVYSSMPGVVSAYGPTAVGALSGSNPYRIYGF